MDGLNILLNGYTSTNPSVFHVSLFSHTSFIEEFDLLIISVNHLSLLYPSAFLCVKEKPPHFFFKERKGKRLPELPSPLTSITMSANKIRNENLARGDEVTGWSMGERHPHTDSFTPITPHGEISRLSLFNAPDHCINTLHQWQNYWNASAWNSFDLSLWILTGSS